MPVSLKALGRGPGSAIQDFVGRFLGGSGVDKARLGEGARTSFGQGSAFRSKFLENSYKRFRHSAGRFWGKVPRKIVFLEGSGKGCRYRCGKVPESSAWGGAMPYIKEMPNKCCLQHTAFSLLWILSRVFFFSFVTHAPLVGSWWMWRQHLMEDASLRRVLLVGCRKKATTHEVRKGEFEKSTHTNTLACFVRQRMCLRGKDCFSWCLLWCTSCWWISFGRILWGNTCEYFVYLHWWFRFQGFFHFYPKPLRKWSNLTTFANFLSWVGGASLHLRSRCVFLRLLVVRFPKFTERGTTVGFCNACGIYW